MQDRCIFLEKISTERLRRGLKSGISRVFQEQALVLNVPVYENLVLGQESRFVKAGLFLDRKGMIAAGERMIKRQGLMSMFAGLPGSTILETTSDRDRTGVLTPTYLLGIRTPGATR